MQTMSNERVSPFAGVHLPSDVVTLLSEANPSDVDLLFDQLREVLTRPVPLSVAPALPPAAKVDSGVVAVAPKPRPVVARKRRFADPLAVGMLRVVLPFGLLLAGLVGLMAIVG
jgi:hypothetical protein